MSVSRTVEEGEIMRKKEAMDSLVHEVSRGEDESLPPSLRSALERGWGMDFIDTIKAAKNTREKEIDKICSRHYGDFLTSVQELLRMRDPAQSLSVSIEQVNKAFEESFQDLCDLIKSLETLQLERENSRNALIDMQKCRDLTQVVVQANQHLLDADYYSALGSIETIREELKFLSIHPFKNVLLTWLPRLTNQLLGAAKDDLIQWFADAKKNTQLLGSTFMRRSAKLFIQEMFVVGRGVGSVPLADYVTTMSLESIYRLSTVYSWDFLNFEDEIGDDTIPDDFMELPTQNGEEALEELLESFAPLHKALHMHHRMEMLPELHKLYCESRELVISKNLIDIKLNSIAESEGLTIALPIALSTLCGFFAVESVIRTSSGAVDREYGVFSWNQLQVLWADACEQVKTFVEAYVENLKTPNEVLLLKEQLLLASETLADDAFGYKDDSLMNITNVLWSVFVNLQVTSTSNACHEAYISSGSQPMYVSTVEMYESRVKGFMLDRMTFSSEQSSANPDLDAMEEEQMNLLRGISKNVSDSKSDNDSFVPHTVPFSEMVPTIMRHLHIMVIRYAQFTVHNDGLVPSGHSLCDSVMMSFFEISRILETEMTKDGLDTPLSKACQIFIDSSSLSYCCTPLREIIANVLLQANWFETIDAGLDDMLQQCRKRLDQLAIEAQHLIFELLSTKIVDLLASLQFVNWVPTVLPSGPHDTVTEIVDYLRATFMWITYLPQTVREAAHFTCCQKINQGILEFVLSPKVQKLNMLSIRALQLDFQHLEEFANSCGIPQLKDCFLQCKELIGAMMHRDLSKFGESSSRKSNPFDAFFPNLDIGHLSIMMEKVVPLPVGAESSGMIPHYDKKALSSICKGIKSLKKAERDN